MSDALSQPSLPLRDVIALLSQLERRAYEMSDKTLEVARAGSTPSVLSAECFAMAKGNVAVINLIREQRRELQLELSTKAGSDGGAR